MPVYRLPEEVIFPPPGAAEPDGLLAVGGDLSPERLLLAYSMGIFPWFNEGEPILWWSPDPRCVLEPSGLQVSRSLARTLRRGTFQVTFDRAFPEVVDACARLRRETWISADMAEAYGRLHTLGYAHSVEAWRGDELVGGLYGVCLGHCFFGESMFHSETDASKVAFATLAKRLGEAGFELIDCQLPTSHLLSLGAVELPRDEFLRRLRRGGAFPAISPEAGAFPSQQPT